MKKISFLIPSFVRQHADIKDSLQATVVMQEFERVCKRVLATEVFEHLHPKYVRYHKLYVSVDHPAVSCELLGKKQEIMSELSKAFPGQIIDIKTIV